MLVSSGLLLCLSVPCSVSGADFYSAQAPSALVEERTSLGLNIVHHILLSGTLISHLISIDKNLISLWCSLTTVSSLSVSAVDLVSQETI